LIPNHDNPETGPQPVECLVAAHAAVHVPLAAVAALRRQPGPPGIAELPATCHKHADEQTVCGLSAILHAIAGHGLQGVSFHDWGVLAAPRLLARPTMVVSLQRFLAEGAWGVSPHVIPHRSLHSVSGTVSPALKMHGPNLGVGGGPGGAVEVLLAAVSMLARVPLPGVWVVWTALEPEGALDLAGRGDPDTACRALAVALTPAARAGAGLHLRLEVTAATTAHQTGTAHVSDYFYLENLLNEAGGARGAGRTVLRELDGGFRVCLERPVRLNGRAHGAAPEVVGTLRVPSGNGTHGARSVLVTPSTAPAEVK
jgi:hypothetical protein